MSRRAARSTSRPTSGEGRSSARAARSPSYLLVVLVVLVLLTVGGLALAARAPTPAPESDRAGSANLEPEERTLVCPPATTSGAAASGITDLVGRLAPGVGAGSDGSDQVTVGDEALTVPRGGVVSRDGTAAATVVTVAGAATADTFAARVLAGGGLVRCPAPRASWWFAGAGGSSAHYSTLHLVNPRSGPAVVDVTVWGAEGQVPGAGLRGIAVRPGETVSLDLAEVAPSPGNLAVHVDASRGLVAASVEDHTRDLLAPRARAGTEYLHSTVAPTRRFSVTGLAPPSGVARPGTESIPAAVRDSVGLVLANPGDQAALAQVRVSAADGLTQPDSLKAPVSVPPGSVVTVPVRSLVKGVGRTAFTVDSDRPLLGGYLAPGTDPLHGVDTAPWEGPAAVALPTDARATLVLSARTSAAVVTVATYAADGARVGSQRVVVPARSTLTRTLSRRAASVVVTADGGVTGAVVVRRSGAGSSTLPLSPLQEALAVPVVRAGG